MNYLQVISDYNELKKNTAPQMLREWRGELSYEKAARQLGCAKSFLWKIEHGTEIISDEILIELLKRRGEK